MATTKITIRPDGPLLVSGDFEVVQADGSKVETKETAHLCRCGKSAAKPFCDGAHRKEGFKG
jgi:CDGSH-type Zn-finger protein